MKYRVIKVTSFQQNCSLLWCAATGKAALVDPGGEPERLLEEIERQGVRVEKLLLTHGHIDHVGAAKTLSDILQVPIIGPHEADAYWLDLLPEEAKLFNFPALQAFRPHQWLNDGDRIEIGDVSLDVLHCPGHTPGHVVFYNSPSQTAFVGDVIFKGSIGNTDFPGGDESTLIHSIYNKLLPLGDDVTFISGHGARSTFGRERRYNPFLTEDTELA